MKIYNYTYDINIYKDIPFKDIKDLKFIKKKTFNKLVDDGLEYSIVGRTKLKKIKDDNDSDRLLTNDNKYLINKYKHHRIKGYIPVGNNKYIEYVGIYFIIIWFILLFLLLSGSILGYNYYQYIHSNDDKVLPPDSENIDDDDSAISDDVINDRVIIDIPDGDIEYEVNNIDEGKTINEIIHITVMIDNHIIIDKDVSNFNENKFYTTLDYTILDMELVAGYYEGTVIITYTDGTTSTKPINIYIRQSSSGDMNIGYTYDVSVDLASNIINMYYNVSNNASHDSIVQIILVNDNKEYLLGQSGKVKPGYVLETISLNEDMKDRITSGVYKGYMRLYFDTDLNEYNTTALHTDIEIEITVQ